MEVNEISQYLTEHLNAQIPRNADMAEVYRYSVLPAGKLFRPSLVWATARDFGAKINSDHTYLASAVEIHHAYSLVHDDLPCMDNDAIRRGRPAVHVAFGEWRALLAGDGLLNVSYGLLSYINSPHLAKILRLFAKYLGPQGLIQGQANDLSGEVSKSFENLLQTHNLKTGRLIQVSILCSYLLTEKFSYRIFINLMKLGYHMGIVFQLLDDFTEFTEKSISSHERDINPWLKYEVLAQKNLESGMKKIDFLIEKHELRNLSKIIGNYYQKIGNKLNQGKENLKLNGISSSTADSISNFISKHNH